MAASQSPTALVFNVAGRCRIDNHSLRLAISPTKTCSRIIVVSIRFPAPIVIRDGAILQGRAGICGAVEMGVQADAYRKGAVPKLSR